MLRQSSSRNYRSKKLRPRHGFQAVLLFAVGIWIVYQLSRSHSKRRAVGVEITDDGDAMDGGGAARRRLGRKGFVGFAGHASESDDDDVVGVGSQDASSDDDPLSKAEDREGGSDGDGDEEDQAADEDDGGDDADDGLAGDEEDGDMDLLSLNGNSEDESDRATVFGNGEDDDTRLHEPTELNSSAVPRATATGTLQDAAASQQRNATDGAADGRASATPLDDPSLKNASSVNPSLHDRGTAGDAAKKSAVKGFAVRGARVGNEKHNVPAEDGRMINQNETADSIAGHGISS